MQNASERMLGPLFWKPRRRRWAGLSQHLPLLNMLIATTRPRRTLVVGHAAGVGVEGICEGTDRLGVDWRCSVLDPSSASSQQNDDPSPNLGGMEEDSRVNILTPDDAVKVVPGEFDLLLIDCWDFDRSRWPVCADLVARLDSSATVVIHAADRAHVSYHKRPGRSAFCGEGQGVWLFIADGHAEECAKLLFDFPEERLKPHIAALCLAASEALKADTTEWLDREAAFEAERVIAVADIDAVRSRLQSLEKAAENERKASEQARSECVDLRNGLATTNRDLGRTKGQLAELESRLAEANDVRFRETEILTRELERVRNSDQYDAKFDEIVSREIDSLNAWIEGSLERLTRLRAEHSKLTKILAQTEEERAQYLADLALARRRCEALEADLAFARDEVAAISPLP